MQKDDKEHGFRPKDITIKEHILQTPSLYIGYETWDTDAIHCLIECVILHMVDKDTANDPTSVKVTILSDRRVMLEDNGNGLPVKTLLGWRKQEPAIVALLEWFMPTGERSRTQYKSHGFISYLAKILNALSEHLRIDTRCDDVVYSVTCSKDKITKPLTKTSDIQLDRGTRIIYEPDIDLFPDFNWDFAKMKGIITEFQTEHATVAFEMVDNRDKSRA
ncbi:MAG: hypothetical protein AAFV98_05765 [Chloroflexota bacterium]